MPFFKFLNKKYPVTIVAINSPNGNAIQTPITPILFDKINKKGMKKNPWRVSVNS